MIQLHWGHGQLHLGVVVIDDVGLIIVVKSQSTSKSPAVGQKPFLHPGQAMTIFGCELVAKGTYRNILYTIDQSGSH